MIVVSRYLIPKGYNGMAIFPFIFLKHKHLKEKKALLNHEKIHLRQQLELCVLPFFIWYGLEFLFRWSRYGDWQKAYLSISFEKEAYTNENDLDYLKTRSFWSFLSYL